MHWASHAPPPSSVKPRPFLPSFLPCPAPHSTALQSPQCRLASGGNRRLPLPQHHAPPEDLVPVVPGRAHGPRDGVPRAPGQDRDGVRLRLGPGPPPAPRHEQRDHVVKARTDEAWWDVTPADEWRRAQTNTWTDWQAGWK